MRSRGRWAGGLFEGKRGRVLKVETGENEIRKAISDLLDLRCVIHAITDARLVKTPQGWTRCVWPAGWPDISAILPISGQFWAIEVKTETGALRDTQCDTLPLIAATGAVVTVARDVLTVQSIINRHYARYTAAEVEAWRRRVRELRAEAAAHAAAELARAAERRRTGKRQKRLTRTVDLGTSGPLFEAIAQHEKN